MVMVRKENVMEKPKIYISLQEIDRLHKVAHEYENIFYDGETFITQNDLDDVVYGCDKNGKEDITFVLI